MKPRVSVLTLGVDDLARALRFYREGPGLQSEGIVGTESEHGAVVFFPLRGSLMLALYPRKEVAGDAQVAQGPKSPTEFTLGHNVNSREEVDEVMAEALRAGARITKPAGPTFWGGYAGYFHDPDGHVSHIPDPSRNPGERRNATVRGPTPPRGVG
jgi:catechol 2,3-dioxygenase-like lactoylglutathione lyase family enzyme